MTPGSINGATRRMGPPPGVSDKECATLHIADVTTAAGNMMVSAWFPSPAEVERMQRGQPVYLCIYGESHPMVSLVVEPE